jgi:hypothetical protein
MTRERLERFENDLIIDQSRNRQLAWCDSFFEHLGDGLVLATSRCTWIMWPLLPFADSYFSYFCF